MSPVEAKAWADIVISIVVAVGGGGTVAAVIGYMKSKREPPAHIAPPTPAGGIAQQIGGMVLSQTAVEGITAALNALAVAYTAHTLQCAADNKSRREEMEAQRKHERDLASDAQREMKTLNDHLDTLGTRIKNMPGCGA
jgi:cysteine synthase